MFICLFSVKTIWCRERFFLLQLATPKRFSLTVFLQEKQICYTKFYKTNNYTCIRLFVVSFSSSEALLHVFAIHHPLSYFLFWKSNTPPTLFHSTFAADVTFVVLLSLERPPFSNLRPPCIKLIVWDLCVRVVRPPLADTPFQLKKRNKKKQKESHVTKRTFLVVVQDMIRGL